MRKNCKKLLALMLVVCLALTLCACKSKEVKNVESLISGLGELDASSESYNKLTEVEEAYDALTDSDKENVENLGVLYAAQVQYVEAKIDAIGEPVFGKTLPLSTARVAYKRYNDTIQAQVSNYDKLVKAESDYLQLEIKTVTEAINAIGVVELTEESKKRIDNAKKIYNGVSKEAKEKCNYEIISNAEKKYKELEEALREEKIRAEKLAKEQAQKKAVAKLTSKHDKYQETTWYYPQCAPKYINNNAFYLYMGKSDLTDHVWLRWKMVYCGNDWIFFDKIIINIDGKNYTYTYSYYDVERDNNTKVWEYVDVNPSASDIEMLRKLATSKEASIRFEGDKYHKDRTITQNEKYGITDVLNAYDALR